MNVTRKEAIDMVIDRAYDDFNDAQLDLADIFRYGWEGFESRSNAELEEVYNYELEDDEKIHITDSDIVKPITKIVIDGGVLVDYRIVHPDGKIVRPEYDLVDLDNEPERSSEV